MTLKPQKVLIHIITKKTIKRFVIIDLVLGSGIYSAVKIISSSLILATISSIAGSEGIKKIRNVPLPKLVHSIWDQVQDARYNDSRRVTITPLAEQRWLASSPTSHIPSRPHSRLLITIKSRSYQ